MSDKKIVASMSQTNIERLTKTESDFQKLKNNRAEDYQSIQEKKLDQYATVISHLKPIYDQQKTASNNLPRDVGIAVREDLMNEKYDETDLAKQADDKIRTFQADASKEAGIFHHLITLPTYHTAALSTDNLAKEYFGSEGMLGYVANVQRKEIRQGIACVKHQNMSGSDMGDDHKEYFAGEAALKAAGKDNTMNQF